jgi:serine/threonine protein kinase
MPAPATTNEFLELVRKSGVVEEKRLAVFVERIGASLPDEPLKLAELLVRDGLLTQFQAEQCLQGKWRRFNIGKYKVLERIGSGGMGSVYLCEHKFMRRRAAVKVLPTAKATDPAALERFYREARAVAALDHPNIVRAYDIDQEDNLHFLVMEYVDGSSLQEIVKKVGPLDPVRTAHYIQQASLGLQHAYEVAGVVHRDIKPGNLIVDRSGTVKILDMGLARFFNDEDDLLTKKYDENVLGTADYLAPEQALDSHGVDIRADIYSLGATFYFCLTGRTPFSEGSVAQKLIWHQTRQPKPIRSVRPDVPEELTTVVDRMMAKDPAQRYQTPLEVVQALAPWTRTAISPPPEAEMPRLSPAARAAGSSDTNLDASSPPPSGPSSAKSRKVWRVSTESATTPEATPPSTPPSSHPSAGAASSLPDSVPVQATMAGTATAPPEEPGPAAADFNFAISPAGSVGKAEEDSPPWEYLTSDTEDPSAKADTQPRAPKRPKSFRLPIVKKRRSTLWTQPRFWWLAGATALILITLATFIWLSQSGSAPSPVNEVESVTRYVSRAGGANTFTFKSLHEAVLRSMPGDRVVVRDELIEEEQLDLSEAKKQVTIEAEPGKTVVWRCPEQAADSKQLLFFRDAERVCVRGFILDGGNRLDQIALLTGDCPGLKLENLQFRGFKRSAILVANCAGRTDMRVVVSDSTVNATEESQAAVTFMVHPRVRPKVNRHILFRGCRFEGPFATPVRVMGSDVLESVHFEGCVVEPQVGAAVPFELPLRSE